MKKKLILALVLVLIMAFAVTGCGGNGSDSTSFKIGNTTEVDTLNPLTSSMQACYEIFMLVYDPLIRFDENFDPIPGLATEWEVSDDNLTWTFKLAEGVKWHDGEPFTSEDVKYTYDLMLDNATGYMYESMMQGISEITCPDENTVVMKTDNPKANMLMIQTPILPKHILDKMDKTELEKWNNDEMIGTGYFKLDEFKKGEFVKLVRNEEYFADKPKIEELTFVQYANADVMSQALIAGEVDMAVNLNAAQQKDLNGEDSLDMISGSIPGFMQVGINCWESDKSKGNPILRDKQVRQAMDYATDRQKIVDVAYFGQGQPGTTLINPGDFYHYEPKGDELRGYDLDKAKALLDKAGYKDTNNDGIREDSNGKDLSFKYFVIANKNEDLKAAQFITSSCEKIGIKLTIETMDDGALTDKITAGDYDMFNWGWGSDIDPTTILRVLITDEFEGSNETFFSNERYDELFVKQQQEMDENKRQEMVFEMEKIAYDESPYLIYVYDNNLQGILKDKWTGYKQIPENGTYIFNLTDIFYKNIAPK